jgi:hypothetical protein
LADKEESEEKVAGGPILFSTLPRGERKEGEEDHQERHTKKLVNISFFSCDLKKASVSSLTGWCWDYVDQGITKVPVCRKF